MIGYNLKKLRLKNGYSMRELGELLDVSHQAISKYEKDITMPSSDMIMKMANLFNVKVAYFFNNKPQELNLKDVHYRKKSNFTKTNQSIVENFTKDKLSNYLEVLDLFPKDRFKHLDIKVLQHKINNYDEIEEKAISVRNSLNLGIDPIGNLLETLEEIGFIVLMIDNIPGFDGKEGTVNNIPFIVLSNNPSGDRQRFSLAHELGHLLLIHNGLDDEIVANRFAGAFLVPKESLISDLGNKRKNLNLFELEQLKRKYKVSMQCIIFRANQLNIISDFEKERLFKEFSMRKWRTHEPIEIENETSYKFQQMVCEAVSEKYISESKGAEYLNISTINFLERYLKKNINDTNK